jgi:hypothetical protein
MIGLTGCGSGGGGSSTPQDNNNDDSGNNNPPVETQGSNQALLGPLSGSTMYAYRLSDLNTSIETVTSSNSTTDISKAGSFDLNLTGIADSEWIIVKAVGGQDIDANDDGVIDTTPTTNKGAIYAIAKASDWREGTNITAISNIIFNQLSSENSLADLNDSAITSKIATIASEWVNDVDGDGVITYKDINTFKPSRDKGKSKIAWNTLLDNYISGIHKNNDLDILSSRLNFTKQANDINGYQNEDNITAILATTSNNKTTIVKTIDTNENGNANAAIIEQSKDKMFAKTKVYQNDAGANGFEYKITSKNGDTLTLKFNGVGNLLSDMNENTLQNLADSGNIKFEEITDANGTYIKLDFPKSIMSLWSETNVSIQLNDTFIDKNLLRVIDDDPVIGWYFEPEKRKYEPKKECKNWWDHMDGCYIVEKRQDGTIMTPDPIVYNTGGIKFRWSENGCVDEEVEVFKAHSYENSTINTVYFESPFANNNPDDAKQPKYSICAKHDSITLTKSEGGTRLLSYQISTGRVSKEEKTSFLSSYKHEYLGILSNNYEILTKISESKPTDTSFDGWSCAFSFKSLNGLSYIGDAEYTNSKLWVALKSKNNESNPTPPTPTYDWSTGEWSNCTGDCGNNNGTQTRTVTCKSSTNVTVEDSVCSNTKPATTQSCTVDCPALQITSPNGGESIQRGTSHTITWNSNDASITNVDIQLYVDGATSQTEKLADDEPNDGSFTWGLSGNGILGDYVIRISDSSNWGTKYDYSDSTFTITSEPDTTKPTLTITDTKSGTATTTDPITFTFTWSEDVSGFTTDDITISGGTKGTFSSTSNKVYTLAITPNSNSSDTITIDVSANSVIDSSSNGNDIITQYTQAVNTVIAGDILWKGLYYNEITSPHTGKVWLDRNLGASRVCTKFDDEQCYGDYYQWGRDADGHEKESNTNYDSRISDLISSSNFIIDSYEWTDDDSSGTIRSANWSKIDGTFVCPIGYRVPTLTELEAETINLSGFDNRNDAFESFLKFPSAGEHKNSSGLMNQQGVFGAIWSSSISGQNSGRIYFTSNGSGFNYRSRSYGFTVRCLKD